MFRAWYGLVEKKAKKIEDVTDCVVMCPTAMPGSRGLANGRSVAERINTPHFAKVPLARPLAPTFRVSIYCLLQEVNFVSAYIIFKPVLQSCMYIALSVCVFAAVALVVLAHRCLRPCTEIPSIWLV